MPTATAEIGLNFGLAAEYDYVRPGYPPHIIEELVKDLPPEAEILDAGSGTGIGAQALLLYPALFHITALEPDSISQNKARLKLADYAHRVKFLEGKFLDENIVGEEETQLSPGSFDAIVAATSFKWLGPPGEKEKRAHALVKPGGIFGILQNTTAIFNPKGAAFFKEFKKIQTEILGDEPNDPPDKEDLKPEFLDPRYFQVKKFTYKSTERELTAAQYIRLISTFGPYIALEEKKRNEFFDAIRDKINSEFDGKIIHTMATTLTVAERVDRESRERLPILNSLKALSSSGEVKSLTIFSSNVPDGHLVFQGGVTAVVADLLLREEFFGTEKELAETVVMRLNHFKPLNDERVTVSAIRTAINSINSTLWRYPLGENLSPSLGRITVEQGNLIYRGGADTLIGRINKPILVEESPITS